MFSRASGAAVAALIAAMACNKTEGGEVPASTPPPTGAVAAGSGSAKAGGFSADLAKELGGKGDAKAAGSADVKPEAGSAAASDDKAAVGSDAKVATDAKADAKGAMDAKADTKAGDAKVATDVKADARAGDAKATPATADAKAPAGDAKATPAVADVKAPAGDAKATPAVADVKAPAGDAKATPVAANGKADAKVATPAPVDAKVVAPTPAPTPSREPVRVSGDLAAIKMSLLPNWDRDLGEAGTFQYVVRIKGTQNTKTFAFHYGYDDPKAPADREQYKKFLLDNKLMSGELKERQRGGAWFIEGNDASGLPAFRYVVLYGGKRLVCYGSLYKDGESSRLGDDRDQTIIQAKQICETISL